MKPFAARLENFGPSAFGEMTLLAQQHKAINLGQGFPDYSPPEFVLAAAQEAFRGANHQYSPPRGHARLQHALANALAPKLGYTPDALNEITITAGATQALYSVLQAIINPQDEVIILEPQFDVYTPQVLLAGGVPRPVQLQATDNGFVLDSEMLRAACNQRTKAILLNTPHNPTGKIFSGPELETIATLATEFNFYVISDEVYELIAFDAPHVSIASLPNMQDRTITIGSAGKMFSVTGWRVGWAVATPEISAALRRGSQWVTFCAATPVQEAVAIALENMGSYPQQLCNELQNKRDLLCAALNNVGLTPFVPAGGYFVVANASAFTNDANAFSKKLVTDFGVAAMPMNIFYAPENAQLSPVALRFAFCKEGSTLEEAAARLQKLKIPPSASRT